MSWCTGQHRSVLRTIRVSLLRSQCDSMHSCRPCSHHLLRDFHITGPITPASFDSHGLSPLRPPRCRRAVVSTRAMYAVLDLAVGVVPLLSTHIRGGDQRDLGLPPRWSKGIETGNNGVEPPPEIPERTFSTTVSHRHRSHLSLSVQPCRGELTVVPVDFESSRSHTLDAAVSIARTFRISAFCCFAW